MLFNIVQGENEREKERERKRERNYFSKNNAMKLNETE